MMLVLVGTETIVELQVKDKEIWMGINGGDEAYALTRQEADALADLLKKLVYTQ